MNLRSLLYAFTLASSFATTTAQLPDLDGVGNFTKDVISGFTGSLQAVPCESETRAVSQCNLAPFSGTYVCREFASLFGNKVEKSVCVRNIVEGFTLGLASDTCGCCGEGCAAACTCACGEGKSEVDVHMLYFLKFKRCMANGWTSHLTNWGNAVSCTEECSGVSE